VKWIKKGLLFDPHQHQLPAGCTSHAQSPQALVFDDFVRIFFSTRRRDESGQFLSYIAFADVDRALERILRVGSEPAIGLGGLGTFDEHGIFPVNIVRDRARIFAFTSGWSRRVSVPVETAIGLAVSHDQGTSFERVGPGPVMGPTSSEPFLVGDPFVIIRDGRWHMWYIFGTRWAPATASEGPARVYKIAHATSNDGVSWERDSRLILSDVLGADECQALPTVIEHQGAWHMYFCFRHASDFRSNRDRGYRLGYARSTDLQHWVRDDRAAGIDVSDSGWDSDMLCYPHVFWCGDQAFMLYNGNEFGRGGFGVAVLDQ
jgi:hypothetical protein